MVVDLEEESCRYDVPACCCVLYAKRDCIPPELIILSCVRKLARDKHGSVSKLHSSMFSSLINITLTFIIDGS